MSKKNTNEVKNEEVKDTSANADTRSNAKKMMDYLKMIDHNEKMILRLEAKIQKLTDANDKIRADFTALLNA